MWAEVGIPMIVGTFLLDSSARAESIAEACEEIAGGNLNNFIVVACIAQAIALTGAAVGGEHIAKFSWPFASGSSCAYKTSRRAWATKLLPKITQVLSAWNVIRYLMFLIIPPKPTKVQLVTIGNKSSGRIIVFRLMLFDIF